MDGTRLNPNSSVTLETNRRRVSIVSVAFVALLLSAISAFASQTAVADPPSPRTPPDLTGSWSGKVGGALHGRAEFTIEQDAEAGTLTGTLTTAERGSARLTGRYTAYGREVNGEFLLEGETSELVKFLGTSNGNGSRLKWTLTLLDGSTARLRASRVHASR